MACSISKSLIILAVEKTSTLLIWSIEREDRISSYNHVVILVSISCRSSKLMILMIILGITNSLENIPTNRSDHASHQLLSILLRRNKLTFTAILCSNQSNIGLLMKRLLDWLLSYDHLLLLSNLLLINIFAKTPASQTLSNCWLLITLCISVFFVTGARGLPWSRSLLLQRAWAINVLS